MRFGLSKSWGKVPAACAGHATGGSMVKFEVSAHSLLFLCMRQRRPTTGSSGFLHFGPRSHLTCRFSFSVLQADFVITAASIFPCATFPLSLIKTTAEAAFLPHACLFDLKDPFCSLIPSPSPSDVARGSISLLCDSEIENSLN